MSSAACPLVYEMLPTLDINGTTKGITVDHLEPAKLERTLAPQIKFLFTHPPRPGQAAQVVDQHTSLITSDW